MVLPDGSPMTAYRRARNTGDHATPAPTTMPRLKDQTWPGGVGDEIQVLGSKPGGRGEVIQDVWSKPGGTGEGLQDFDSKCVARPGTNEWDVIELFGGKLDIGPG